MNFILNNRSLLKLIEKHEMDWLSEEAFESGITTEILQFINGTKTKDKKRLLSAIVAFLLSNSSVVSDVFAKTLFELIS